MNKPDTATIAARWWAKQLPANIDGVKIESFVKSLADHTRCILKHAESHTASIGGQDDPIQNHLRFAGLGGAWQNTALQYDCFCQ